MTVRLLSPLLSKPEKKRIFYMQCYGFLWLGLYIAVWEVKGRNTLFRRFVAKSEDEFGDIKEGETDKDASVLHYNKFFVK